MEKGNHRIIRISEGVWQDKKRRLGFSEPMPEFSRARMRKFLPDLMMAQALLGAFENSQTDSSVLEKWRNGLFGRQRLFIKQLESGTKNIENEKRDLILVIIDVFSDCLIKIKAVLHLLEKKEHQTTDEYEILQELSIIVEKFVSDLRQSTPQNAEQIISEFRKSLSEIIEIEKK